MIDDKQTQVLPKEDAKIDLVGVFMGYDDGAVFRQILRRHLERVEYHYAELFEESPDLGGSGALVFTGSENHPATVKTLTGMGFSDGGSVSGVLPKWTQGRYRAIRSQRAGQLSTAVTPHLPETLAQTP